MIRAVLFDIDGTLVDSNDLHVDAWAQIFGEAGHDVAPDAIRGQIGKGGDNLLPTLLPGTGEAEQKRLSAGHGRLFRQLFLDRVRPFPGAADLLRRTHAAGRKVVLASSAEQAELDHYMKLLDVKAVIDATTSIDDVGTSKPAPDIFATALKKIGVRPDEAVAVGDTPYDAQAAAKSGIGTVAVLSGGFDEAALREAGAGAVYPDVAALLAGFDGSPLAG